MYNWQTPEAREQRQRDAANWQERRRQRLTAGAHPTPLRDRLALKEEPDEPAITWLERMKR